MPLNGWSISRIRKIDPEIVSAQTNRTAMTVALRGGEDAETPEGGRETERHDNEERRWDGTAYAIKHKPARIHDVADEL
jgi:hypothetical protein